MAYEIFYMKSTAGYIMQRVPTATLHYNTFNYIRLKIIHKKKAQHKKKALLSDTVHFHNVFQYF